MPAPMATAGEYSSRRNQASTVADSAIAVPADRSMPPEMMIIVMPSAATATVAALHQHVLGIAQRGKLAAVFLQVVGQREHADHQRQGHERPEDGPQKVAAAPGQRQTSSFS